MVFMEALEALEEGKYLSRDAWDATGEYVVLMPSMSNIWRVMPPPSVNAGNWLPSVEDFKADDWKLVSRNGKTSILAEVA